MSEALLKIIEGAMKVICESSVSERQKGRIQSADNSISHREIVDAIVEAHEKIKENEKRAEQEIRQNNQPNEEECSKEKLEKKGDSTAAIFGVLAGLMMYAGGILLGLIAFILWVAEYVYLCDIEWGRGLRLCLVFGFAFFIDVIATAAFVSCLAFMKSGTDISVEKDRNYVVAVFSAMTSLAAIIVALVALMK